MVLASTAQQSRAIAFRLGLGFLAVKQAAKANQITVATPTPSKEAGETFTAVFTYSGAGGTTGDLTTFGIELWLDDDGTACGNEVVSSLCIREAGGMCTDSNGSYDVQIPDDAAAGKYSIKVMLAADETTYGCSDAFEVTRPVDDAGLVVEAGEASLEDVEVDAASATLQPSTAFTSRWAYDDGAGKAGGTFRINLNACGEDGDCDDGGCGTLSAELCGDAGCYDPGTGDYDVTVPADQPNGEYKLEVISTDDPNVKACSESSFSVADATTPASTPAPGTAFPVASVEGEPGSPGYPPSPVPEMPACDDLAELEFTYDLEESTSRPLITVAHASGDRSEAGCLTLTKLYDWLATASADVPTSMLLTVDPTTDVADPDATASPTGVWLLDTSLEVTNGVTFEIKGTAVGGDCDELKLSSTVTEWNRIMGYGGNIDIDSTVIRSWDATMGTEHIFADGDEGKDPRSYISCVSEVVGNETCEGAAQKDMGECRMDIIDSTLSYLGYDETESYGISWKVRGLCDDLSNVDVIFESVRVYGDLKNSEVFGLWYGHYSYGHLGGVWTNNILHDNHVYGFDPHDDSDYLIISGNMCYNNSNHGIIASKRCDHLLVENNESYNNGGSGIMLHKMCDDSIVRGNQLYGNLDAGLSLVETSRCNVTGNVAEDNRWGLRTILGSTDNFFENNSLIANTYVDLYQYYGASEEVPEMAPFTGVNTDNVYRNNNVTHVVKTTVTIEWSDGTEISNNFFSGDDNGAHFVFTDAENNHIVDNIGDAANGLLDEITDSCFTPESDRTPLC